jgi:ABC-type transport system substrate-binding protein
VQGVQFHDGTPFDATAAKWNFDRILDPETGIHVKRDTL